MSTAVRRALVSSDIDLQVRLAGDHHAASQKLGSAGEREFDQGSTGLSRAYSGGACDFVL
jgi:hypothetical protein